MPVLHNLRLPTIIGRLSPSHNILISLIFTLLGIHLFITWYSARQRLRKHGEKAPAAPSWAPFGIDLLATAVRRLVSNDFFTWSRELLSVPGRTVSLNVIGQDLLMTDAPDNIKAILSTHFSDWAKGETFHTIWKDLMLDSIFASDGALWHANKDMLRAFISKVRTTDYDVTEKHISQLFQNLEDGESYDCFDQIDRFSLDVVTDVFFGESAGTLTSEKQPVREAVEDMYVWNTKRVLVGNLGPFLPGSPKASGVLNSYLDRVIDKAMATDEESDPDEKRRREDSMLGSLLRQGLSRKLIKDAMLAIVLGGKDPSSITLVWVIYELARQPEILVKLREEIANTVGFAPLPTPGQLKQMPLLQNIIKETLRLHPPVGYNIRVAAKDTSLPTGGGLDGTKPVGVLKGTHISMSRLLSAACQCLSTTLIQAETDFDSNVQPWCPTFAFQPRFPLPPFIRHLRPIPLGVLDPRPLDLFTIQPRQPGLPREKLRHDADGVFSVSNISGIRKRAADGWGDGQEMLV